MFASHAAYKCGLDWWGELPSKGATAQDHIKTLATELEVAASELDR